MSGARSGARATGQVISAIDIADISIRTLREEGDVRQSVSRFTSGISIHALCEEGDAQRTANGLTRYWISIHALREEGDKAALLLVIYGKNFYPRPPRGGRPIR